MVHRAEVPNYSLSSFTARLKSCPDTKPEHSIHRSFPEISTASPESSLFFHWKTQTRGVGEGSGFRIACIRMAEHAHAGIGRQYTLQAE